MSELSGAIRRSTTPDTPNQVFLAPKLLCAQTVVADGGLLSALSILEVHLRTPPPEVNADGVITVNPPTGARTLNVRTTMFFGYTFITPAMIMRLTDIGSQYLIQAVDSKAEKGPPIDSLPHITASISSPALRSLCACATGASPSIPASRIEPTSTQFFLMRP